jgi:predicted PurR-regulated permease PerM
MTYKKLQIVSFLVFLLAVFILVVLVVKPFLNVLAFGTIMAILFWPVYSGLQKLLKSNTVASLITVLAMLALLVLM